VARVQESHKGHEIVIEEPTVGAERRVLEEEAQEEQPRLAQERRVSEEEAQEEQPRVPQEFRRFIPAGGGGERRMLEEEAQEEEPRLFIDERPVKVIRNSDGTYSSEGVFYTSYPTLLDLARASIDMLRAEG
jgi:Tyrosinase co-factor MelC1